jgi:hypothetical protein|tara:strand:- start:739 stop:1548 length:810 start_codon:yes stop_codon:yes gene_type:complete
MNQDEITLRDNIRRLVRLVKEKKLREDNKVHQLLGVLMDHELSIMLSEAQTPDVDPSPNKSTGINVLEELLKKIIPVLETDYKSLTTNSEQRESFRAHIVNAVVGTLTPAIANDDAGDEGELNELEVDEEIEVNIGDEPDDKFIDIRTDAERTAEDGEEEEEDPRDAFGTGVEGDKTGRNMAYQSFKKIESSVIDSYELLSNEEDQELFYDYLIANLKLYFDKFEGELSGEVEEPTNQAYDTAKQDASAAVGNEVPQADPVLQEFDLEI